MASKLDQFIAEEQKTTSTIPKQMRLWKEESARESDKQYDKAQDSSDDPPPGGGGRGQGAGKK